jgi:hypothetical protein
MTVTAQYEYVDPLGNRLTVEALNSTNVVLVITQDDGGIDGQQPPQTARVIIGAEDMQKAAEVVRVLAAENSSDKED